MFTFLTNSRPRGRELPSPDGRYVALLGAPREVWGNYLADLALWTAGPAPRLLYHRAGHQAHFLPPSTPENLIFGYWTPDSKWLIFYEFKRQETYQLIFIDVPAGQAYRVPASDELLTLLPTLAGSSAALEAQLHALRPAASPLLTEAVTTAELRPR